MSDLRPRVCVLDVNETLSDLSPLDERFDSIGLTGQREAWFASVLRDGFALSMVGQSPVFADIAAALLRGRLVASGASGDVLDESVQHVLGGFPALPMHPDVAPGLRRLHAAGVQLVPLTNGATRMSDALFEQADVLDLFEHRLSVEDVGPWKPHPAPYAYALEQCAVSPNDALMVAVHPWDLQGAHSMGLRTAWVRRQPGEWPSFFAEPAVTATGVDDLAAQVLGSD
ncbi:MAG: haloacid dehalogenase type II [Nocardioidaceae bacterium]|jgi:2-haloacid dehalogenase|nr:haloacid dehalogenase type II [Nocardioidaceae bacterium]MDQ3325066.1 haloacid dehalogenase type II [Actinomycetota bacterium]